MDISLTRHHLNNPTKGHLASIIIVNSARNNNNVQHKNAQPMPLAWYARRLAACMPRQPSITLSCAPAFKPSKRSTLRNNKNCVWQNNSELSRDSHARPLWRSLIGRIATIMAPHGVRCMASLYLASRSVKASSRNRFRTAKVKRFFIAAR